MKSSAVRAGSFWVASVLFLCSGALGLGYELVWIRKAALVVGASPAALATVLTAFFLGLAGGSYVVGRLRNRRRSPLFVYGLFELAIGAYAFAFPWLFELLRSCYGACYPVVADSNVALLSLRFGLLFVLFLPPTFLMGGTLPLLLDGLVAEDRSIASRTSLLYAVNILGAVGGVLLTCYVAIPSIGMNGASVAGGVGNTLLGFVALWYFRAAAPIHTTAPAARVERRLLLAAFLAGLVAIGLQIVWARYFSILEVTTIYTTAMLLAVFLLGLSLGSGLLAWLARRGFDPIRVLVVVLLLVPIAVLVMFDQWRWFDLAHLTLATLEDGRPVPLPSQAMDATWALWSEHIDTVFLAPLFKVAAVVLLPVLLMGMAVPALIATAAKQSAALRAASGAVLFWNTVGCSAGAFVTGYALVPQFGMHATIALLLSTSVLTACIAWSCAPPANVPGWPLARVARAGLALVSLTTVAGAYALRPDVTRHALTNYGLGKQLGHGPMAKKLGLKPAELIEVVEGPLDTCYLFEDDAAIHLGSGCVSLASVGKVGVSGQAVQGHLPAIFFPGTEEPRRCLGICLGSGQSFGALLLYGIASLDVVDISASVVELSLRRLAPYNHGLGSDPRVRIHLDDGRHFVERAPDRSYDVVSMEPPPPDADGVHSLYSVEFYREVRRVLDEHGVLMQWLPLYRVTPMDAQNIVKTLAVVFPETFIMFKGNQDLMTLSYKNRPRFSADAMRRRCAVFSTERNVDGARFGPGCQHEIASFEGMLAAFMAGPAQVQQMQATAVYEDDTQLLGYGTGDRYLLHRYRGNQLGQISYAALPESAVQSFAAYFEPALASEVIDAAILERSAAMQVFKVPRQSVLQAYQASLEGSDAGARCVVALATAAEYDRGLRKLQAFLLIAEALAAKPDHDAPSDRELVRAVVRNHFAVYVDLVRQCVRELAARYPASALVAAMQDECAIEWQRERERLARYWSPRRSPLDAEPRR